MEKTIFPTFSQDTVNKLGYNVKSENDSTLKDSFVTNSSKRFGISETTIKEEIILSRDIEPEVQEFIKVTIPIIVES